MAATCLTLQQPVIMVHGGPGGGCSNGMRRYHDPKYYRIILLDQRGAGRSTPHADLHENTCVKSYTRMRIQYHHLLRILRRTWHLIDDMEKLRRHLKIERWQVFGGSWGSTLVRRRFSSCSNNIVYDSSLGICFVEPCLCRNAPDTSDRTHRLWHLLAAQE